MLELLLRIKKVAAFGSLIKRSGISMLLVGANSSWRPGDCSPLCIANHRQETAPTKRYLRISSRLILQSKIKPNL